MTESIVDIRPLSDTDIPRVIELSLKIFDPPDGEDDSYHSEDVWKDCYAQDGLIVGAFVNGTLAGYVFFYHRDQSTNISHCWMAGVAENARRQGLLTHLMEFAQKILLSKGYDGMTVNTYPEDFPAMFLYLTTHGYEIYKEEATSRLGRITRKCFFTKSLRDIYFEGLM